MPTKTKPKFQNCLSRDIEYQKEYQRLEELRQKLKRLEMGDAFGVYPYERDKTRVDEAIEATRQGEQPDPVSMKTARQRTRDEIFLMRKAVDKQERLLQGMRPAIWRRAAAEHKAEAKELFSDFINSAESFWACMVEFMQFHDNLRGLCGIADSVLPWRVEQNFFREFGISMKDGGGRLKTFIERSKKRLENGER